MSLLGGHPDKKLYRATIISDVEYKRYIQATDQRGAYKKVLDNFSLNKHDILTISVEYLCDVDDFMNVD